MIGAVTLLLLATPAWAATWEVPQDYDSLQDAVYAAVNGDVIIVDPDATNARTGERFEPGSSGWTDHVWIDRSIDIQGVSAESPGKVPGLKVEGSNGAIEVAISNLQVFGYYEHYVQLDEDDTAARLDAAIYVSGDAQLTGTGQIVVDADADGAYFDTGLVVVDAQADIGGLKVLNLGNFRGAYLLSHGGTATLTLRNFEFVDNSEGGIYANGALPGSDVGAAILALESGTFRRNSAQRGGGIEAQNLDTLSLTSVLFYGNSAEEGGAVFADDVAVGSARDVTVRGDDPESGLQSDVSLEGAGFALRGGSTSYWTVNESEFENLATESWGGSAVASRGVILSMKQVEGRSLTAPAGAFVRAQSGFFLGEFIEVSGFEILTGDGGAFHFDEVQRNTTFTLRYAVVCGGGGFTAAGALAMVSEDSDVVVEWSVFQNNARETIPLVKTITGRLALLHNTFVNNDSTAAVDATFGDLLLYNNIFTGNPVGAGAGVQGDASTTVTAGWNLWNDFSEGMSVGGSFTLPGEGGVNADPGLWAGYDPADCDARPYLSSSSPALDAGTILGEQGLPTDWDLELEQHAEDSDGSPPDMGAFGGLGAEPVPDDDGDGYSVGLDCDDTDPNINPGAADIAGDGVDSNCDGIDEDQGDEEPIEADGDSLFALVGGCSSVPGSAPGVAWLMGLLGALMLRRRRQRL